MAGTIPVGSPSHSPVQPLAHHGRPRRPAHTPAFARHLHPRHDCLWRACPPPTAPQPRGLGNARTASGV